jgi:hypothetical protein
MAPCITDKQIAELRKTYGISVRQTAPGMTILNGVPCFSFNKEYTNLLILCKANVCHAFVDFDLVYKGINPDIAKALSTQLQDKWRRLTIPLPSDPEEALMTVLTMYLQSPAATVLAPHRQRKDTCDESDVETR